jgi:hypothetical protein
VPPHVRIEYSELVDETFQANANDQSGESKQPQQAEL